jgi:hypothetical protein
MYDQGPLSLPMPAPVPPFLLLAAVFGPAPSSGSYFGPGHRTCRISSSGWLGFLGLFGNAQNLALAAFLIYIGVKLAIKKPETTLNFYLMEEHIKIGK